MFEWLEGGGRHELGWREVKTAGSEWRRCLLPFSRSVSLGGRAEESRRPVKAAIALVTRLFPPSFFRRGKKAAVVQEEEEEEEEEEGNILVRLLPPLRKNHGL